ncbi:MAG: methylated-DNA--[protein]-cysteine S-methyltransferase [Candidatus Rokuibacteriota bacterium]
MAYSTDEARWAAVARRDRSADGAFYFSVRTTGIYCRPSCAARRARRENVRFYATCEEAEAAGFRACRRCRPNSPARAAPHSDVVGASIRFAVGACSLGSILVAITDRGICAILLGDEPAALVRELQGRFPRARLSGGDAGFEQLVATVVGFVETPARGLDVPLDLRGTAFQRRVWQALREIPAGATASYTELAKRIGAPTSVRAVGRACASNAIAVAIPCHRAVRNDGGLAGYRWGVTRKRALLAREAAPTSSGA